MDAIDPGGSPYQVSEPAEATEPVMGFQPSPVRKTVFRSFFVKKLERKFEEKELEVPQQLLSLMDVPFEEFTPEVGSTVRGFAQWWSYYDHQMAVEFIDEKGTGKFMITDYEGDFFGAMDLMKLGRYVRADDIFSKKFVKFEAVYDEAAGEIEVRIPTKGLMFRDNEEGRLQVDLRFLIYIYADGGAAKESFADARAIVVTDAERDTRKTVDVRFARRLKPGTNFVDVLIMGKEGLKGKIRQIFEFKVAGRAS